MYNCRILTASLLLVCSAAWAQTAAPTKTTKSGQVAPGVAWENFVIPEGPKNYNIMRVNIADPRVTLETESAHDALFRGEKVLQTIEREDKEDDGHVVAGVNADFWRSTHRKYTPVGLLVADGMIYTMPDKKRSAFLFGANEQTYIGQVTMNVTIGADKVTLKITDINPDSYDNDEVSLFTPPYGSEVKPLEGKRYLLAMNGTEFLPNQPIAVKVTEVSSETSTPLDERSMVLQIPTDKAKQARTAIKDRHVAKLTATIPQLDGVIASACGGGPTLVRNGKPDVQADKEGIGEDFVTTRHPRTAIGITRDQKNVFLVTIDGRQPKISIGADLYELAEFMAKLGCWTAMNLDGGGSTTMVVGNEVKNSPSDLQGPRTVATSLLVVLSEPATAVGQPGGTGQ